MSDNKNIKDTPPFLECHTQLLSISQLSRYDPLNQTVVFADGGVLYNDKDTLNLFNKSGSLQWSFSLNDLGYTSETHTFEDSLNVTEDGRIIICVTNDDYYAHGDYIISLATNQ